MKITILFLILSTAGLADELVRTPGGSLPRSRVARVAPGQIVRQVGEELQIVERTTQRVVRTLVGTEGARPNPNWITYTMWQNATGKPISSFTTNWKVPPPPSSQSAQLIYLFNGLEPGSRTAILQPVLQWGTSPAGGGAYWAVASWYVTSSGSALHTDPIRVNPGDELVGVMALTGSSGRAFSYTSRFDGIANTTLQMENITELLLATETLEAYSVGACAEYPDDVAFTAIGLSTGIAVPSLTWTPHNNVTDCGQHVGVINNSASAGEVDIHTH